MSDEDDVLTKAVQTAIDTTPDLEDGPWMATGWLLIRASIRPQDGLSGVVRFTYVPAPRPTRTHHPRAPRNGPHPLRPKIPQLRRPGRRRRMSNHPRITLRLRAAAHEAGCFECRVTWRSWAQRMAGVNSGYSPKLSPEQIIKGKARISAAAARRYSPEPPPRRTTTDGIDE